MEEFQHAKVIDNWKTHQCSLVDCLIQISLPTLIRKNQTPPVSEEKMEKKSKRVICNRKNHKFLGVDCLFQISYSIVIRNNQTQTVPEERMEK
jgi:hypothetical protein